MEIINLKKNQIHVFKRKNMNKQRYTIIHA